MGGTHSQSYNLSNESLKSVQEKQDIVPSNNTVDGTLIHISSSGSTSILPTPQELRRTHPPEEIPLTPDELPVEHALMTKASSSPKVIEAVVE